MKLKNINLKLFSIVVFINLSCSNFYFLSATEDKIINGEIKENKTYKNSETNEKIKKLEEIKRGYEAKAIKYANQAQRLQFEESELQKAKKLWKLSDDSKKIAQKIQKEIDELKAKK